MACDRKLAYEMTLSDALSDPLIRSVMSADGVQHAALERMLNTVAHSLKSRRNRGLSHCTKRMVMR
jgi:hypothetical protein